MKKLPIIFLCFIFLGCAGHTGKLVKNYDDFMKQANELAIVLCTHSEFSTCYWQAALGDDINKLPAEALNILDEIEQTVKGKTVDELTECEKGKLLGLWQRFTYLVGKDIIEKVVPYMIKFVGAL
ncbi:MAG: hypothetical protein ACTSSF_00045 [Candidatus Heimdallarchaeaceae archaeon]